jgi:hypothetical protein
MFTSAKPGADQLPERDLDSGSMAAASASRRSMEPAQS